MVAQEIIITSESAITAIRITVIRVLFSVFLLGLAACSSTLEEREEKGKPFPLPDYEKTVSLKPEWSRSIGNGQGKQYNRFTLALDYQAVCAAARNGKVACFDHDGKKIWRRDLNENLLAGAGLSRDYVLVVNADGWLIALQADTGEESWRKNLESEVLAAPVGSGDRIIVQNTEGIVIGLDGAGEPVWEYKSDEPLLTLRGTATPVINNGAVFCGFANGKIVALDLDTGVPLWDQAVAIASGAAEIERLVDVDASPLVTDQSVFASSYNGYVFLFDRRDGRPRWRTELSSLKSLAQGFGNVYAVDEQGRVLALDAREGEQRWENSLLLNRGISDPVVYKGYLLVADDEGYIHAFSQTDGALVGRARRAGSGVRVPMLTDRDLLYVYTNDGKLLAMTLQSKD